MDDAAIKKSIRFGIVKKISQYPDLSWEINTKSGNKYRFKADNPDINEKWYNLIKAILDPNVTELNFNLNSDQIINSTATRRDTSDLSNNGKSKFCFIWFPILKLIFVFINL